jgi:alkylresorcinol/alkylpyrone synthase
MKEARKCEIIGVEAAFPKNYIEQKQISLALKEQWQEEVNPNVLERLHNSVLVKKRHIAMSLAESFSGLSFAERNQHFIDIGLDVAEDCINRLLDKAKLSPTEVSQIIFTSITGIAVPSLDARLMNRIAFKKNLKRIPIFGLGCVGGAASLARAADYLVGHPDEHVLVLCLELCSLTFQKSDHSVANMIASGLFGDGAAAALLAGKNKTKSYNAFPAIIDNRSFFFPNSENVMGWDITNDGFKIILNADVPKIAQEKIPACIDEFLADYHLSRSDIAVWVAHPGGPKVIEALLAGLKLPADALAISYESLKELGNLSSASVLLILQKTLERLHFKSGQYGILLAMGPAFCAEVLLLKW